MSKSVSIRVLVENTACEVGTLAEHGWAVWIDTGHCRILFDAGQGVADVLTRNALRQNVPLRATDAVVLSHGHYDHTGALPQALSLMAQPVVFAHPAAFTPKYTKGGATGSREVGMPEAAAKAVREYALKCVDTTSPTEICAGVHVTGPVPRRTTFEDPGGAFFLDRDMTQPDPLLDDQALYLDSREGTVVVLGCAHAGVINTLAYIHELTGGRPLHTVIGGMHLGSASARRLTHTIAAFRQLGVQRFCPGHCTGIAAVAALWTAFPDQSMACHVGARVMIEV